MIGAETLPDLLRRPLPEVRALQDRALARTIELCHAGHPYYSAVMKREGLEPRHIQGVADLHRLPPTSKQDFLNDPDAFRLSHPDLTMAERTLWKILYTTGSTTGIPAAVYVSTSDHYDYMVGCTRREDLVDLHDTDMIASLFPLTQFPMGAYARAPDEAAAVGASITFGRTGRPTPGSPLHQSLDDAVRLVERQGATVLWGVASFIRRVLVRAGEMGADFSRVRISMITGEASSAAMRADMSRRMSAMGCAGNTVVNRYGSTEQGGSMVECAPGSGFHSLAPNELYHEVIDQNGNSCADGVSGDLAFTQLTRRGTVLLRYLVGDVVSIDHTPCPHCGRTSPRVASNLTRSGDLLKIKGMLVNLRALKDWLEAAPGIAEYQIVIRPSDKDDLYSMDELVLKLAATDTPHDIAEQVANLVGVRPLVQIVAQDEIFDPLRAVKPVRVVDERP